MDRLQFAKYRISSIWLREKQEREHALEEVQKIDGSRQREYDPVEFANCSLEFLLCSVNFVRSLRFPIVVRVETRALFDRRHGGGESKEESSV